MKLKTKILLVCISLLIGSTIAFGAMTPIDYRSREAREDSLKAQVSSTSDPSQLFRIGDELFKIGKIEEANRAFKKGAITSDNTMGAATCARLLGDYDESVKNYSKLIEKNAYLYEAYFGRALAYRGLEEYNKAIEDFKEALKIGKSEYSYAGLGDLYILLGRDGEAKEILEEGNKYYPESALIKKLLVRAYKR